MPKSQVSAAATAALMQQQMETVKRLEKELAETKARTEATQQDRFGVTTQRAEAKPTNGQAKNDFLPWIGELLKPNSPGFLPLGQRFTIALINHSRFKESKEFGKQLLLDISFLAPFHGIHKPGYTWSLKVDDLRIPRILDLLASGKTITIYRDEYPDPTADPKEKKMKSTIKIA